MAAVAPGPPTAPAGPLSARLAPPALPQHPAARSRGHGHRGAPSAGEMGKGPPAPPASHWCCSRAPRQPCPASSELSKGSAAVMGKKGPFLCNTLKPSPSAPPPEEGGHAHDSLYPSSWGSRHRGWGCRTPALPRGTTCTGAPAHPGGHTPRPPCARGVLCALRVPSALGDCAHWGSHAPWGPACPRDFHVPWGPQWDHPRGRDSTRGRSCPWPWTCPPLLHPGVALRSSDVSPGDCQRHN